MRSLIRLAGFLATLIILACVFSQGKPEPDPKCKVPGCTGHTSNLAHDDILRSNPDILDADSPEIDDSKAGAVEFQRRGFGVDGVVR